MIYSSGIILNQLNISSKTILGQYSFFDKLIDIQDFDKLTLTETECSHILSAMKLSPELISAKMNDLIEKHALRQFNLSLMNTNILMIILLSKEITQTGILEHLYTTPANLSQRINWLIQHKMIKYHVRNNFDRRKKLLTLTQTGKELTLSALKAIHQFKNKLMKNFSREEIKGFFDFHIRVAKTIEDFEKMNQDD